MILEVKHRPCYEAICMHGIYVFRNVIAKLSDSEHYEIAQLAKDVLIEYCRINGIDVPKDIVTDEDFQHEFWRIGIEGETAKANFPYYIQDCYDFLLSKH